MLLTNGVSQEVYGTGKALLLNEKLFTPNGYIKMKDVKLGDTLIDGLGKECKVTGIFPQGRQKCYKIKFSDNTDIICSYNHLWKVRDIDSGVIEIISTENLYNSKRRYAIPSTTIDVSGPVIANDTFE